jgi:hypothetical protein
VLGYQLLNGGAGHVLGAEGLHQQRQRPGDTDGVRYLHLGSISQTGRDNVFGHITGRVSRGAVYLGRILAGERAAAVPGEPAVSVHDDLPAGQPGIAHRSADHEPPGGVDEQVLRQPGLVVEACGQLRQHDVFPQIGPDLLRGDVLGVLDGDQHLLHPDRHPVPVADGHLCLAVGPKVGQSAVPADGGELLGQPVRQRDRHRHQLRGLVGGVAEHHPLVTRPGTVQLVLRELPAPFLGHVDALSDVR